MDRLRVVTFSNNRRPTTVLDINDDVNYSLVRDTLAPKPSNRQPQYAQSGRRYGGARLVNETHDNGTLEAEWYISGTTSDNALQKMETLLGVFEDISGDRWVEWRMDGASNSIFYQIRGPATWEPMYRWIETMQTHTMHFKGAWAIAPLGEGLPLDIYDPFDVDSLVDYLQFSGAGTLTWTSSGVLTPTSTANKLYVHAARGYEYDDQQVTFKFTTGASGSGTARSIGAFLDASNYLFAENTGTTLRLGKRDLAAESTLGSTSAFALSANTTYWLRYRSEQNNLIAEIFTSEPTPNAAPAATAAVTLAGADATKFGSGVFGQAAFYITPQATDWRVNGFTVEPYTYRAHTLPETQRLRSVPGSAPSRTDLVASTVASGNPLFGFLTAWQPAASNVANLVANGDFETATIGTQGWSVAAVASVIGAATSIVRDTSAAKFGTANGQVVTPATTDTGANYVIYRRFKKGTTYTLSFWARSAAQTTALRAKLGVSGDLATGTAAALSTTFQQYTVTWTPTADRDSAFVVAGINAATATTFQIDGVQVYEGTVAPSSYCQIEGRGAYPAFGVVDFANLPLSGSGLTSTTSANYRSGTGAQAAVSGSFTVTGSVLVDPSALHQDDFQHDEIALEVWVRMLYDATVLNPLLVVSANPLDAPNIGAGAYTRYTHEWGSAGKTLQGAAISNQTQLVRAGTITLPVDSDNCGRWIVSAALSGGAGSSGNVGFDYALLVPVRQRASTPSSKPHDSTYPAFFSQVASGVESIKTVYSDLSAKLRGKGQPNYPDTGLGGQLLELPAGDVDIVSVVSNNALEPVPLNTVTSTPNVTATLHYAITPRYFLGRGP